MDSTICFFRRNEKSKVEAIGSGVFIKFKQSYFVVTTAHMITDNLQKNFVILTDKELTIGGEIKTSKHSDIDIAVMKVDKKNAESLLQNYVAIPAEEIDSQHELTNSYNYFLLGYPITKTKQKWQRKEIESEAFSYRTKPNFNFNYLKFNLSPAHNIAVEFEKLTKSSRSQFLEKPPSLIGISGSGLWFLDNNKKMLIGIVIEQCLDQNGKNVIATRMNKVLEGLNLFV